MRINTNVSSLQAQEAATNNNKNISSSLEKLSTGLKINKASDDAAGTAGTKTFQMGDTATKIITLSDSIEANVKGMDISSAGSADTHSKAQLALDKLDKALTTLNKMRSNVGSTQNQVESSVRSLQTAVTNLNAAESVIRDVDYAQETANFNKQNIISQAGTYAISQANSVQQNVTKLLQ